MVYKNRNIIVIIKISQYTFYNHYKALFYYVAILLNAWFNSKRQ